MANSGINSENRILGEASGSTIENRNAEDSINELRNELKKIEKLLNVKQTEVIEVMGIFVTLFSFISINVQIFNRVSSAVEAGLFMVLIFCSLSLLILLLDVLLKPITIQPVPFKIKKINNLIYRTYLYFKYLIGQILQDIRSWATILIIVIGVSSLVILKEKQLNKYPEDPAFVKAVEEQTKDFYSKAEINLLMQENKQNNKDYATCLMYKGISNCLK